ncbi:MAG: hypothetical protein K6G53_08240, partial [Bacteroidales bacterium]|nr:hypothetical protein [Bacteroidales bacterium]
MKRLLLTISVLLMACFSAPAQNVVGEIINDVLNDVVSEALDDAFDGVFEKARERRLKRRAEREARRAAEDSLQVVIYQEGEDGYYYVGDSGYYYKDGVIFGPDGVVFYDGRDDSGEEEFYDGPEDEYDEEDEDWDYEIPEYRHGLGVYGGHYYMTGYSNKTGTSRQTNFNDKFHLGIKYSFYEDDDFGFLVKYEQNTFWESYQGGYPISESVYAPGVELFFRPNPDLKIVIGYESRTNGGDGDYLRKMNFARLSLYRYFPLRDESFFSMGFQTYLGAGFVGEDRSLENLYLYKGFFTAGAWYQTPDSNFKVRVTATPYDHLRRCGVEVNMYYRPYYSILDNVYFMIQYGYGLEQMQQYLPAGNDLLPQHYIRFGISFCPEFTL